MSQKCSTYIGNVELHPDGTLESYECCCRGFESRFERTVNSNHHLLIELWPGSSSSYRSMSATSARETNKQRDLLCSARKLGLRFTKFYLIMLVGLR